MGAIYGSSNTKNLTASGFVTADGKKGILRSYILKGGTTASSVQFRNGGASGTVRWEDAIKAQTVAGDDSARWRFKNDIPFATDIYATLAGTDAEVWVEYVQTDQT